MSEQETQTPTTTTNNDSSGVERNTTKKFVRTRSLSAESSQLPHIQRTVSDLGPSKTSTNPRAKKPVKPLPQNPSEITSSLTDFGNLLFQQLDDPQHELLRRFCERRISQILGEEKTMELLKIPSSGNSPKFFPLTPMDSKAKGLFGMPLYLAVKQTGTSYRSDNTVVCIPFIVHECLNFLSDKNALKTDGIFRKPGNSRRMTELQITFDTRPMRKMDFVGYSVHDVAGLLKRYIRELPEPIFTLRLQSFFFAALEIKDRRRYLICLQLLLIILPQPNRDLLHALLLFLKKIAQNSKVEDGNRMDSKNLAVIFAPNIAKTPGPDGSNKHAQMTLKQAQEEGKEAQLLVETLIDHSETLFSFQEIPICEFPLYRLDNIVEKSSDIEIKVTESTENKEKEQKEQKEQKEEKKEEIENKVPEKNDDHNDEPENEGETTPAIQTREGRIRPRYLSDALSASRTSLPNALRHPLDHESKPKSHLSVEEHDESSPKEDEGEEENEEKEDEDNDEDDGKEELPEELAKSAQLHSGRVFDSQKMNPELSKRVLAEAKKKTKYLFGEISKDYAIKTLKKLKKSVEVADSINFDEIKIFDLFEKMRETNSGIEVKNRRKILKVFKACFLGKDAIDWLCVHAVENRTLSRTQAQQLARELLEIGLILQVFEKKADLKDSEMYYRFLPLNKKELDVKGK